MIRGARLEDVDFLVRGNRSMARETEGLELDEATVREGVRAVLEGRQPGAYRIAEVNGRPAAQLMVTYEWSDWRNRMVWWIQSVWVEPEHRGRGLFSSLYASVKAEAEAAGAGGLRLYVDKKNELAHVVYAALGMNGEHYQVFEAMFDVDARPAGT